MKELDLSVFVAVFQEMLGILFWPLVAVIAAVTLALLLVVVRDRRIVGRRVLWAELAGVIGGFVAVWFMLAVTGSRLADIGGPVDWVLALAIWIAGAIGAAIAAYAVMSLAAGKSVLPTSG